jgi:hypothetical protein
MRGIVRSTPSALLVLLRKVSTNFINRESLHHAVGEHHFILNTAQSVG